MTHHRFLFDSLAHDNDASFANLTEIVPTTESDTGPILASGIQRVRKFNRSEEDDVFILLAVHRLESRAVDLVLTQNVPLLRKSSNSDEIEKIKRDFFEMARSLVIADHNLFA